MRRLGTGGERVRGPDGDDALLSSMTNQSDLVKRQGKFDPRAIPPSPSGLAGRYGYLWANEQPGWGIDLDEAKAARYPITVAPITWTQSRWPDGTLWTP